MAIGLWKLGLMTLQSVEVSLLGLVAVFGRRALWESR